LGQVPGPIQTAGHTKVPCPSPTAGPTDDGQEGVVTGLPLGPADAMGLVVKAEKDGGIVPIPILRVLPKDGTLGVRLRRPGGAIIVIVQTVEVEDDISVTAGAKADDVIDQLTVRIGVGQPTRLIDGQTDDVAPPVIDGINDRLLDVPTDPVRRSFSLGIPFQTRDVHPAQ